MENLNISIKETKDKTKWNDFVIKNLEFYTFLCSFEWAELNQKIGNESFCFEIFEAEKKIGQIMLILKKAKRGNYFLAPHSPIILEKYFENLEKIIPFIKDFGKKYNIVFLRINSLSIHSIENKKNYEKIGFLDAPMHEHTENTHILEIGDSEENLLKNMRQTTRYMIKRGEKEGVLVEIENDEIGVEKLIKMHEEHSKRDNGKNTYSAFSPSFIKNLFEVFEKGNQINLFRASFEGVDEAILTTIKFGKSCAYYISASKILHPKFSPAYLLQWKSILDAKNSGCEIYNFWGVSPDENKKHPIFGVSQYKRGFGGKDCDLLHAQDFVFSKTKYFFSYLIETLRRIKRGYYYKKYDEK